MITPHGEVHIFDVRKATPCATRLLDGQERIPRPLLVLWVASGAVRVVVALDDLGAEDVVRRLDPESGRSRECGLVLGRGRVVGCVGGEAVVLPAENLGADVGGGGDVRVVAGVGELEAEVDVLGHVEGEAAEDEVAAAEAGEMLRDEIEGLAVPHGEIGEVGAADGVRDEVLHRGVGGEDPAAFVVGEADRVVQVHLDQVLVEAVIGGAPATTAVDEFARGDLDARAQEAGEGLADELRPGAEKVGFGALGEFAVHRVSCDITEASPLEHEGADGGNAVGVGAKLAGRAEVEAVIGHPAGGVEGDLEVVGEVHSLLEDGPDGFRLACLPRNVACHQVVGREHPAKVTDGGLKQRHLVGGVVKVDFGNVV